MSQLRIGISGWTYGPWRGTFYPKDLPHKRELEYASRQVNSIEINGSFYSLQTPKSYGAWYEATPDDFVFSLKGGRFITHMKKLKDVGTPLANYFASGVLALGEKLGPVLWQFPPQFGFDAGRFEAFFDLLPRDHRKAAKLAKRHDERLKGRALVEARGKGKIRHAVEIRHESFRTEAFLKMLRRHDVALVVADTAGKWPFMEDVTAKDFVYARLHGDEELYVSGYTDEALDAWAAKLRAWAGGGDAPGAKLTAGEAKKRKARDVYVYFDNDVKVRAPFDAMELGRRLGVYEGERRVGPEGGAVAGVARERWPGMRRAEKSKDRNQKPEKIRRR